MSTEAKIEREETQENGNSSPPPPKRICPEVGEGVQGWGNGGGGTGGDSEEDEEYEDEDDEEEEEEAALPDFPINDVAKRDLQVTTLDPIQFARGQPSQPKPDTSAHTLHPSQGKLSPYFY
jgi:hypothetical protein